MKHIHILFLLIALLFSCKKKTVVEELKPVVVPPVVIMVTPTITGFNPLTAQITQEITITGTGFGTDINLLNVQFADGANVKPKSATSTQIVVVVPSTAITGLIKVFVTGLSAVTSSTPFTLLPTSGNGNGTGTGTGSTSYKHTIYKLTIFGGNSILSRDKTTLLSTDFSHANGANIQSDRGVGFEDSDGTDKIYKTELFHAENATITRTKTVIRAKLVVVLGDTTRMPYFRYINKDEATKTVTEYRAYFDTYDPGFWMGSISDFPDDAGLAYMLEKLKANNQKLVIRKLQIW